MALVKCPECGKEISDRSNQCVHCGYPLETQEINIPSEELTVAYNEEQVGEGEKGNETEGQLNDEAKEVFNGQKKNKFVTYLKVLVPLQLIFGAIFLFIPTVSGLLTIISVYGATILCVLCLILGILCNREARTLPTKKGKKTSIVVIVFEILVIATLLFSLILAENATNANNGSMLNSEQSNAESVDGANVDVTTSDSEQLTSEDIGGTNWESFTPSFIGDIPVGCVAVSDAKPQNVSSILKKHLDSDETFVAYEFGGTHIKRKMVIEDTLSLYSCTSTTAIFNFDWDDTLSSIVFKIEGDGIFDTTSFQQLHDEISLVLGVDNCWEFQQGFHKDPEKGHYTSCSWTQDGLAFKASLSGFFEESGKLRDGELQFERTVSESKENLSVPTKSDSLVTNGVLVKGTYKGGKNPYVEGTATNTSSKTVKFIKVKVSLYNDDSAYGKVIDTDWTYAVGAEGLAPGETTKWIIYCSEAEAIKLSPMD